MTHKPIFIAELVIEVTRRCNMNCAHCLRGEKQNLNMHPEIIDKTFTDISDINMLVFTGGEPTLNVPLMRYVLQKCKEHETPVYGLYLATNGKKVTRNFLSCMLDWYAYCVECNGDGEFFNVALSQDAFHEEIDPRNITLLRALSFFDETSKKTEFSATIPLLNEGRAKALSPVMYDKRPPFCVENLNVEDNNDNIFIEQLYVSANGDIKTCCDTAYNNDRYTIGNLYKKSLYDIAQEQLVLE